MPSLLLDALQLLQGPANRSRLGDHLDHDPLKLCVVRIARDRDMKVVVDQTAQSTVRRFSAVRGGGLTHDVPPDLDQVTFVDFPARVPQSTELLSLPLIEGDPLTHHGIGLSLQRLEIIERQEDGLR